MGLQIFIGIACLIIVACIVLAIIDSNRFVVKKYELTSDRITKEIHFVFISDLHNKSYGPRNEKLLEAIEGLKPQFIMCGGDIPTANPGKSLTVAIDFMNRIADKYKIFYANGNHEQRLRLYPDKYGKMHSEYDAALKKMGIERLVNRTDVWEDELVIHGLELERRFFKRIHKVVPTVSDVENCFKEKLNGDGKYHIMLAHNPEFFDVYAKTGVDLVLSGHVHGGVVRLPFLGGVISPSFRLFPTYDGGYFQKNGCEMIISRGLGVHTIPIRFLNPAELVEVTIHPKQK